MAAITWRNVNAQDQTAAARFSAQGSKSLNSGLGQIGAAAQGFENNRIAEESKLANENTQSLINTISQFGSAELAEAKASGAFSQEVLQDARLNPDQVNKIFGAMSGQEDVIYNQGKTDFNRTNELAGRADQVAGQEFDITQNAFKRSMAPEANKQAVTAQGIKGNAQTDAITGRNETLKTKEDGKVLNRLLNTIPKGASLDEGLGLLEDAARLNNFSDTALQDAKNKIRGNVNEQRLSNKDSATVAADQKVVSDTINAKFAAKDAELKTLGDIATSTYTPPTPNSPEFIAENNQLADGISEIRRMDGGDGDKWFGQDLESVKKEIMTYGRSIDASPEHMLLALKNVSDGEGDYSRQDFESELRTLTNSLGNRKAKAKQKSTLAAANKIQKANNAPEFVNIQALFNSRQAESQSANIGKSAYINQSLSAASNQLTEKLKRGSR